VPRHGARLDAPLVVDYSASRGLIVNYFAYTARLVRQFVAPLVVDYSASRRLVVDYFASAARSGAPARRAARHVARRVAHRRLLRVAQARRRLLRLTQARRRLLRLCHASGCLGTARGSSRPS
jgi:hypothetical protein